MDDWSFWVDNGIETDSMNNLFFYFPYINLVYLACGLFWAIRLIFKDFWIWIVESILENSKYWLFGFERVLIKKFLYLSQDFRMDIFWRNSMKFELVKFEINEDFNINPW